MTLCELPLVLPPAVAGIALLSAFGRGGLFGDRLQAAGIDLPFGPWAVVLAITFVASPFYLRQAIAAFEALDPELTDVARTLGASRTRAFWRVALPLARGGLVAGWVLAFARGIGEFGATIIFAGNVQGRTTTLTLAVYQQLDVDIDVALALGVLLLALSVGDPRVVQADRCMASARARHHLPPSRLRRRAEPRGRRRGRRAGRAVGGRQDDRAALRRRAAPARPRPHRVRRRDLVRARPHRGPRRAALGRLRAPAPRALPAPDGRSATSPSPARRPARWPRCSSGWASPTSRASCPPA